MQWYRTSTQTPPLRTTEGVLYAEKDFNLPKHPEIEVPNLQVIKLMQSFKSKELVTERFAWRHYYWCAVMGVVWGEQPASSQQQQQQRGVQIWLQAASSAISAVVAVQQQASTRWPQQAQRAAAPTVASHSLPPSTPPPSPPKVPDQQGHRVPARVPQPARGRGARHPQEVCTPHRRAPQVRGQRGSVREGASVCPAVIRAAR